MPRWFLEPSDERIEMHAGFWRERMRSVVKLKHLVIEYRRTPMPWGRVKKVKPGAPWCQVWLHRWEDGTGFSEDGYVVITEERGGKK